MPEWPGERPPAAQNPSQGPVRPAAEARDRDIRRLQGLQMLMERAAGAPLVDLAAKYRVSEDQADEIMSEAWQTGILDKLTEKLITELSPLAMATYEAQLKMGNIDAARDVLGTIGVIQRPATKGQVAKLAQQGFAAAQMAANKPIEVNDIESYRLARQQRTYRPPDRKIDFDPEP